MKKTFNIKGMHCNSCADSIEQSLKDKVENISVSYKDEKAEIEFDENKISESEIKEAVDKLGYELGEKEKLEDKDSGKNKTDLSNKIGWVVLSISVIVLILLAYYFLKPNIPEIQIPGLGENTSLFLLFFAGLLTGFHCISMCGGFVVSYTSKNAVRGHKSFTQHLVYGGSKVISYTIIGGVFGLIGGIVAFSIGLRSWVAVLAGIFMIFYALSMFGIKFFRKFQFNPKFLTRAAASAGSSAKGPYKAPLVTGLLNGLFIACGPLQAMYLYAAGTGNFASGAASLMAFGLGTLPVMFGFGSLATIISHNTTKKILKFSAVIVLILGLIMLNRGLNLMGSSYSYDSIKEKITNNNLEESGNVLIKGNIQEVSMNIDASGYHPNTFVLKKGIPVKWNVNVEILTGCNKELVSREYGINSDLKKGLNVFEFTPDKTGTFSFTCGMGMLRGSFVVTDSGTASQQQVQQASPKSSSCSMGSSCGCGG